MILRSTTRSCKKHYTSLLALIKQQKNVISCIKYYFDHHLCPKLYRKLRNTYSPIIIPYPLLALPPHDVTEHCGHVIYSQCSLLHSYQTTDTPSTDVHTQQILQDHTSWMTGPTHS